MQDSTLKVQDAIDSLFLLLRRGAGLPGSRLRIAVPMYSRR